ncbi:thiol:disulfide interchange protein DsbA/DsbL [Parashewanella curva]|uniref:Thiol:disulfide interchange protein n=1 Tax=Parashewanella curva TaxID=2338552 RepID=A0A3L8Q0L6_9GAMM|nr:thiol:disulfide interchange protein DsbA/DsbL [Parashewanella curva]RLV60579.1 thiol:disulfide interchange protein DsbA/DsbL [Parashewanella curva]
MKKLILALTAIISFSSFADSFKQGTHYTKLENPAPTAQPTVTEYFSFYCSHCYRCSKTIVPNIKQALPSSISFRQVHTFPNPVTEQLSKTFVLSEQLGKAPQIEAAIFDAIHKQKYRPKTKEEVKKLAINSRIKAESYSQTDSFMVATRVKKHGRELKQFDIQVIPTLVINGQYKINLQSVKSDQELLALVKYLTTI